MNVNDSIRVLQEWSVPTNSFLSAIMFVKTFPNSKIEHFVTRINQLTDSQYTTEDLTEARMTFLYLVQELVKKQNSEFSLTDIFDSAKKLAKIIMVENSWMFVKADSEEEVIQQMSNIEKAEDLVKQNLSLSSKEMINLLVEKLDVKRNTASQYYYTLKTKLNIKNAERQGPTKKSQIENIYKESLDKSKRNVVKLFMETFQMSKTYANSSYFQCKKKFGG